jgi:hypothetical protein
MTEKSPAEELAETSARLAISQKYLARDDNPNLDPFRQDQLDRNRIPGALGGEQLSPMSAVRTREALTERDDHSLATEPENSNDDPSTTFTKSLSDRSLTTLGLAAFAGFVLGAIWKA